MPEGKAARHSSTAEPQRDCLPGPVPGRQEGTQTGSTPPSSERLPLLLGWPEANFYCLLPETDVETPARIQPP